VKSMVQHCNQQTPLHQFHHVQEKLVLHNKNICPGGSPSMKVSCKYIQMAALLILVTESLPSSMTLSTGLLCTSTSSSSFNFLAQLIGWGSSLLHTSRPQFLHFLVTPLSVRHPEASLLFSQICHNRNLQTSKAPLKREAQGTSLFTSTVPNQRACPKDSPWEAQVRLPEESD